MQLFHLRVYIFFILCKLTLKAAAQQCMNDNDCENGGNCQTGNCNCNRPFFGSRCQHVNTESCSSDTNCRNGGDCSNTYRVCVCDGFWYGPTCETICPGEPALCQNGGQCVENRNRRDDFECSCINGYSGQFCEVCPGNDCLNGGTRNPTIADRIVCMCPPDWRGPCCQDESINCNPPCRNGGTCIEEDDPECICPVGWTGEFCEELDCDPPCANGGTCMSGECICPLTTPVQLGGPSCEDPVNAMGPPPCDSAPCLNGGTCTNMPDAMYGCECPIRFTGASCEEEVPLPCESDPCQNGGTCTDIITMTSLAYNCSCPPLYLGQHCEENACDLTSVCMNGGSCTIEGDVIVCECPNGFTGNLCEMEVSTGGGSIGGFFQDNITIVIIIAVVLLVAVIFIFLCVIYCCCMRKKSNSRSKSRARRMRNAPPASTQRENHHTDRNDYIEMTQRKRMEFPRKNLRFMESIGSGAFATVYKANAYSILKPGMKSVVAVKVLKENATENDRKDFLKELSLFKALGKHENLVTFLGCCTDQDPVYLIMEYLPNGNLQQYLRSLINKNSNSSTYNNQVMENQLSPSELLGFGIQISKGMEFLSSKQCVHRDLAARNILLGENNICKISDFGLARDVADSQEYEMKSRGRVPVRWLSPESLLQNIYTTKSDVWSFGIVMWEIITLGSHPYPGMTPRKVLQAIQTGYRLPQPDHCEDEIYAMLKSCWEENPANRPSFHDIRVSLERMMEADQGYLQMDNFHQDNYLYLAPDTALAEEI